MKKQVKYDLFVIGSGGTGTYFLKEISRFLYGEKAKMFSKLVIFDGDIVEEKNLKRQCFLPEDVGYKKSAVMADVLNGAFDLSWIANVEYVTELSQLEEYCSKPTPYANTVFIPVVICCADNHGCRKLLEEFFHSRENCVYFDSANEFATGEVVFTYKFKNKVVGACRSEIFPDMLTGDTRSVLEMSCEELNNSSPQHIFVNMLAGNILCSAVANLLEDCLHPGVTLFNCLEFNTSFRPWKGEC